MFAVEPKSPQASLLRPKPSKAASRRSEGHGAPSGLIQRQCDACSEEDETLQREASAGSQPTSDLTSKVREVTSSSGAPLDDDTRSFMESRFHHDFSSVRIHTDARAAESASAAAAHAYTLGDHVVFGAGRYEPTSRQGQLLIAHELTHVLQQRGASSGDRALHRAASSGAGSPPQAGSDTGQRLLALADN